ncbi:MAG: flippase-like domain-containing protein, partial [Candidatus Moranbacteria bacterium]|nr:flippase-like domain-containing protein [Candidatus Moranbacteria bacterium]
MHKAFQKMKSNSTKTLLKSLVSLFLAYVLFRMIDWNESWELVRSVDFGFLFFYTFLLIVGIGISSYKWKQLADFLGFTFPFGRYFQWYLAGTFVNNFFPSIVGGDTYRAFSLGKKNDNRGDAIASV